MTTDSNRTAQLEVSRHILRLVDEVVDYTTASEKALYDAAERLAELVMEAHNARTQQEQRNPGYVPADNPDSGLVTLTANEKLPPWVVNPRPRVQIEPYIPTSYAAACGTSEF